VAKTREIRKVEQHTPVESASRPEVDVLDRGRQAELGRPQIAIQSSVLPLARLAVDEEAQAVLEG